MGPWADLLVECDGEPRRLGDVLDPWQRDDFEALEPGWNAVVQGGPTKGVRLRAYLERPRGHSKTTDLAIMAASVLALATRPITGVVAAADADQAALLRKAIQTLIRLNPIIDASRTVDVAGEAVPGCLEAQQWRVRNVGTGSELEIISSDAASSYGLLADFIIADELVHWRSRELWDSLLSAAAKKKTCMFVCISNAGTGQGSSWQWKAREVCRQDRGWYFSRLEGPSATWITADRLEEQRRHLPEIAYRRLWLNQWTTGSGDAIAPDALAAALNQSGPLEPGPGWTFSAGLDLGLTRDASALVVVGRNVGWAEPIPQPPRYRSRLTECLIDQGLLEAAPDPEPDYRDHPATGRTRLAVVRLWRPRGNKVSLEEVERAILHVHARYNLACLAFDPWQAQYLGERLTNQGVPVEAVDPTPSNLKAQATVLLEAFSERQIDLYEDADLLEDLRNLLVVERQYGIRLDSPRGPSGHGDAASALSLALHVSRRYLRAGPNVVEGPLLCWP
jgi:phage terminase large subunit-like protein